MQGFCAGSLCHAALRLVVLGREVAAEPARLADHALRAAAGGPWSVLVPEPGAVAEGQVLTGLSEAELARLDFHMAVLGQVPVVQTVVTGAGAVVARLHLGPGSGRWQAAAWLARDAGTAVAVARDVMARFGRVKAPEIAARLGPMLVRAASRVRAAHSAPTELRWRAAAGDVVVAAERLPYAQFFAVEEYDVAWRRFDGAMSPGVTRAAFILGDAVTVLPYDPRRDLVLVVEQFRAGPLARGDAQAWQIEAIAGRIDPGETPEAAARREAVEEAGLRLTALIPVAQYYPSTGAVSEYVYSYVALTDLPEGSAGVFGVASEAEDIRGHLISFDRLMDLVASGEVENAPLILTALWLQRERGRLRL